MWIKTVFQFLHEKLGIIDEILAKNNYLLIDKWIKLINLRLKTSMQIFK